jgi:pimeloyl-ACP methyl ester carboxylesterase
MTATTLAYDRAGDGEPLVLLHPLGADRGVWEPVTPLLAPHHDVIALDLPGFGGSPELAVEVEATPAAIAACAVATMDELGLERAHVAGISLGGWVGLELAKTDRCLSVTTLCSAGFWRQVLGPRPELARGVARALSPVLGPLLRTRRGRNAVLRGPVAHPERVPPAAARRLVRSYAFAKGYDRANAAMRSALFEGFGQIQVPITMAWAEHDRSVYPPPTVPDGVRKVLLTDCGHIPTWDSPEQVARVVLQGTARA